MQSYELCADMIDVVIDVSCIYVRNMEEEEAGAPATGAPPADSNCVISLGPENACIRKCPPCDSTHRQILQ